MGKRVDILTSEHWHPGEDKLHQITEDNTVDMSSFALTYRISRTRKGPALLPFTDKTVGSGIAVATAVATVTVDAADTTGMKGAVWYRLWRTDVGDIGEIAEGQIDFDDIGL